MSETEPQRRFETRITPRELKKIRSLYRKTYSLTERFSVPYRNSLLLQHGVEMVSGGRTPLIQMTNRETGESFHLSIIRPFIAQDEYDHLIVQDPNNPFPSVWFRLGERGILNYKREGASTEEIKMAEKIIDGVEAILTSPVKLTVREL